jgi:hypothetical protein
MLTVDASTIVAIVAIVVTLLLAAVGALVALAVQWGRARAELEGARADIGELRSWLHEHDAKTEQRLFRLEQAVDLTPPPRDIPRPPTGPSPTIGRARVSKPQASG